jgi:elongation factor 1 alpha-like protein
MSRHQAVRNLDYQDVLDEVDGYSDEGDDDLSPEDEELMRQGVVQIQAALGSDASKVKVDKIREALWNYYYDIDECVTFLTRKFIAPPPKVKKPIQATNSKLNISLRNPVNPLLGSHENQDFQEHHHL